MYHVSDFGALITDTTGQSLQTALDSAFEAGIRTVMLDQGEWRTSQTIKTKVSIIGYGQKASRLVANTALTGDILEIVPFTAGTTYQYNGQTKTYSYNGEYRIYRDFGVYGIASDTNQGSAIKINTNTYNVDSFCASFISFDNIYIGTPRLHGLVIEANWDKMVVATRINNVNMVADPVNTQGDGIRLAYGVVDSYIHNNDIGYFKKGAGIRIIGGRGDNMANNKCWQNLYGYKIVDTHRLQGVNNLSDYAGAQGFFFERAKESLFTNLNSRQSSVSLTNTFESYAVIDCDDLSFINCQDQDGVIGDPAFPQKPKATWYVDNSRNIRSRDFHKLSTGSYDVYSGTNTNIDIDPTWQPATLTNGWVSYGAGFQDPQFRKENNTVYLQGLVCNGNGSILTLPTGYRPSKTVIVSSVANPNVFCRLTIDTNGNVTLADDNNINDDFVSLNIKFSL